jgi:hypothetical protein
VDSLRSCRRVYRLLGLKSNQTFRFIIYVADAGLLLSQCATAGAPIHKPTSASTRTFHMKGLAPIRTKPRHRFFKTRVELVRRRQLSDESVRLSTVYPRILTPCPILNTSVRHGSLLLSAFGPFPCSSVPWTKPHFLWRKKIRVVIKTIR